MLSSSIFLLLFLLPSCQCLLLSIPSSFPYASPRQLIGRGMDLFRSGDINGSIEFFDAADRSVPDGSLRPFLWQRGISYYYADRLEEGSRQFRYDVSVNPLDVEEIVWDIACLSRLDSTLPKTKMMSLPAGKSDKRKIMSNVYSLFRGEGSELKLMLAGYSNKNIREEFYSLFYLGLYCESKGEMSKAENYMRSAVRTPYAMKVGKGDYMTDVARVHCRLRGWVTDE